MAVKTSGPIRYFRKGAGSYQLAADWSVETGLTGHAARLEDHIELGQGGNLKIAAGYVWDGPSGPTIDTRNSMRGSLAHDALYQLGREGRLGQDTRGAVDRLAYKIWRQDGMGWIRARLWLRALRLFAADCYEYDPEVELKAP